MTNIKIKLYLLVVLNLLCCTSIHSQNIGQQKLSSMVRRISLLNDANRNEKRRMAVQETNKTEQTAELIALVKSTNQDVLSSNGCRILHQWGDIYATSIPINRLSDLAKQKEIMRIEAGEPLQICVDTTVTLLRVTDAWHGINLSTPLTGKGVIMGIQDIGFDLTHPTFYSRDMKNYRIKAFWDMLDEDTLNSTLPVGRDYTGYDVLMQKKCSRDGMKQTHGTHTAGIAAGSGYDSPFIGMAPEAELCLVSNAVSSDMDLVPEDQRYKYTTATDIVGFQYIFDYATSVGKPCVISFSEGAHEDLYGDAQLLYEVLGKMTGEGRIIVASAGNSSAHTTYLNKPVGKDSISSFIYANGDNAYYTLRHREKTSFHLSFSDKSNADRPLHIHTITTEQIFAAQDSLLIDSFSVGQEDYILIMATYPSCYNADEWATELYIKSLTQKSIGLSGNQRILLTLTGKTDEVECFASGGLFLDISNLPQYHNAVATHNINFPAAASSVIAVGATAHRTGAMNYKGVWKSYDMGNDGRRWAYSSVGPTMQGLTKPDVMAPGCNVISAYSSYYLENNPNANDISWDVKHFTYQGREYAWNCNSGTSMSAPVVGGIMALWLQLYPKLTPQQAKEVIRETSFRYNTQDSYPNNYDGWGEINAIAGAEYIQNNFLNNTANGIQETDVWGNENATPAVYDLKGMKQSDDNDKGIYLIKYKEGQVRKILK